MLDQVIFLRKHSPAESTLKLLYFHVDLADVLIMVTYLGERFTATMTANILFFFGMSSDMIIEFAKT